MTVPELNKILARELGINPFGGNIYRWAFSEELFWPAIFTGRRIEKRTPSGVIYMEREYTRGRMTNKRNVWIVVKWFAPDALTDWQVNFPGAPYPARGAEIHTDWVNKPGVLPSYEDTQVLIWALRHQLETDFVTANNMFEDAQAKERAAKKQEIMDEVRDDFTAFLNVEPGSRGGAVSFPSVQKDIVLPPDAKAN